MTEEIEAHVLKKYEILQKLGKYRNSSHNNTTLNLILPSAIDSRKLKSMFFLISSHDELNRERSLRYCLEGHWQED